MSQLVYIAYHPVCNNDDNKELECSYHNNNNSDNNNKNKSGNVNYLPDNNNNNEAEWAILFAGFALTLYFYKY